MNNIYLLGFMGAGKSATGKALAGLTGLKFRDSDAEVKKAARLTAADVIRKYGLIKFRRLENSALRQISGRNYQAVALGGGVTLTKRRAFLARTGITVYLACAERTLLRRLSGTSGDRPLLGKDPAKRADVIRRLLKKRRPYYEKADLKVDVSNLTTERAAAKIKALIEKHDEHFFKP